MNKGTDLRELAATERKLKPITTKQKVTFSKINVVISAHSQCKGVIYTKVQVMHQCNEIIHNTMISNSGRNHHKKDTRTPFTHIVTYSIYLQQMVQQGIQRL